MAIRDACTCLDIPLPHGVSMEYFIQNRQAFLGTSQLKIGGLYGTDVGPLLLATLEGTLDWTAFISMIRHSIDDGSYERLPPEILYGKASPYA